MQNSILKRNISEADNIYNKFCIFSIMRNISRELRVCVLSRSVISDSLWPHEL